MIFGKKKEKSIGIHQSQKEEYFDFDRIESFYRWKYNAPSFQNINDHTWADLDMNEVFMYLDRTHSRLGQQYLYYLLRSISSSDRIEKIEQTISKLNQEKENTSKLIDSLRKLNTRGSYFLISLFSKETLKKPRWFLLVYFLFFVTISAILSSFFYPQIILVLLCCLVTNFVIHYWNKAKLLEHSNAISQLYHFDKACSQLSYFDSGSGKGKSFLSAQRALKRLTRKSSLLRDNSSSQNELSILADSIVEILKASFLIEPIMLYHITQEIEKRKNEIELLFESIGFIDACISIEALRITSDHTIPKTTGERILKATQCFHPLIDNPVANSIDITFDKCILISGSNMSGKTTFIRTLGVNALLGQTINTVFAAEWTFPKAKIFSAIRISDNLLNDESFYQKEVKVIQEMIEESTSKEMNLFLIDELYKGTNSIERIGAGVAVLSYLHSKNNIVCASTHDLELADFLTEFYTNYHFTEQVNNASIKFDYKLNEGKLQNTNAIRILETNGYPKEVTDQARRIVTTLSKKNE
ncbi:MutS-related protein [Ekhidna sp.]